MATAKVVPRRRRHGPVAVRHRNGSRNRVTGAFAGAAVPGAEGEPSGRTWRQDGGGYQPCAVACLTTRDKRKQPHDSC